MKLTRYSKEIEELGRILRILSEHGYKSKHWKRVDAQMGYDPSHNGKKAWSAVAVAAIMLGPPCKARDALHAVLRMTAKHEAGLKK